MKKRILSLLLAAAMVCVLAVPAFAADNTETAVERIDLEDGAYVIVTTEVSSPLLRANGRDASRTYNYYNGSSTPDWSFTLNASFTYDNSTAKATNASCSYKINRSGWTCTAKDAYCAGASAYANGIFKYSSTTRTVNLSLTCSPSGAITGTTK